MNSNKYSQFLNNSHEFSNINYDYDYELNPYLNSPGIFYYFH